MTMWNTDKSSIHLSISILKGIRDNLYESMDLPGKISKILTHERFLMNVMLLLWYMI